MTLFDRARFETFVGNLPHVAIVHQWGNASVGKVGPMDKGKIFAILSDWSRSEPAISFKCSDMSFEMLPTLPDIRPAPYLARAKWVQVGARSPLSETELESYIAQAHMLVWEKLPLRVREQLQNNI